MLAWKMKCALSGDRWDFQVNMGPLRTSLLAQRTTRGRALYYPQLNSRHVRLETEVRSGDRWDFQVNLRPLRARLLPHRTMRRRARALYDPQYKSRRVGLETEVRP